MKNTDIELNGEKTMSKCIKMFHDKSFSLADVVLKKKPYDTKYS